MAARIGQRIRAWREYRGLSQRELGRLIQLTGAQVSRMEQDNNGVLHAHLERIAAVLGVSLPRFFGHMPTKSQTDSRKAS